MRPFAFLGQCLSFLYLDMTFKMINTHIYIVLEWSWFLMFWTHIVLPVFNVYSKSCKIHNTTTMVPAFVSLWLTDGTSKMVWCACVQFPFYPLGVRIGKDLGLLGRNATRRTTAWISALSKECEASVTDPCTLAWFWHLTSYRMSWTYLLIYIHYICSCGNHKSF